MRIIELFLSQILAPSWNANRMDDGMAARLRWSIRVFGIVLPLVVRCQEGNRYETIGGAQRLAVLKDMGVDQVLCVLVEADDAQARLLSQALNRLQGQDDLGLRADLLRDVLETLPMDDVLKVLPETHESLHALVNMGKETMAAHLQTWQAAQAARLKHLQFQLLPSQFEVVEEALARLIPEAKSVGGGSPNVRGTALYLICKRTLDMEEVSP